jgi:hypothetical protein
MKPEHDGEGIEGGRSYAFVAFVPFVVFCHNCLVSNRLAWYLAMKNEQSRF